ncbi:MAG: hypothetical protein KF906_05500 [Actinobacteria bacterium]|nr:hypothetical protein [Actinomycetota bacterium]
MGEQRWLVVVAVIVVIAAIAAIVIVQRGRHERGGGTFTTMPTTTEDPSTTTEPDDVSETQIFAVGDGVTVEAPPGALSDGAEIVGEQVQLVEGPGELFDVVSGPIELSVVSGRLEAPVTVVFDLPDPRRFVPPDEDDPVVVALHEHDGELEAAPGEWSGSTYRVALSEFSSISLWSVAWGKVTAIFKDLLSTLSGGLYQDVDEPECTGPDAEDRVTVANPDGPLLWCTELADDETVTVRVANRRRYTLMLDSSAGTSEKLSGTGSAEFLSEWVSSLAGDSVVALAPGDGAVFTVPPKTEATVTSTYDGLAHSATSLLVSIDFIVAIAGFVPFLDKDAVAGKLETVEVLNCAAQNTREGDPSVSLVVQILTVCFNENVIKGAVGTVAAALIGPILASAGMLNSLVSYGQAGFDLIVKGTSDTTITISAAPIEPTSDPGSGCGDTGPWPTCDDEGPPVYFAWLGASFSFPSWSSCNATYCIAGIDGAVLVTRLSPLEDLGTIPLDADPVTALAGAGLTRREVVEVLQPGDP